MLNIPVQASDHHIFSGERGFKKADKMENVQSTAPAATVEADGLAVFKEGKLVNWLEGETARGVLWLRNKVNRSYITLEWGQQKQSVTYDVIRQKTNVSAKLKHNRPAISVHVEMEGDIGETTIPIHLDDPQVLNKIEKSAGQELKRNCSIRSASPSKTKPMSFNSAISFTALIPDYGEK